MYRVSVYVGKNSYIEYCTQDLADACQMAEKMDSFTVYNDLSGHEIDPGRSRIVTLEREESDNE